MINQEDQIDICNTKYLVTYKNTENNEINKDTYDKNLKLICKLESINNLVYFLKHLKYFEQAEPFYINVFKDGIQPVWEDSNNKNGCSWSLVLRKEICHRYFEKILIRMYTGFFKTIDPTGIVGVSKDDRFKLSIWARNVPESSDYGLVVQEIKSALDINFNVSFQFKRHSRLINVNPE